MKLHGTGIEHALTFPENYGDAQFFAPTPYVRRLFASEPQSAQGSSMAPIFHVLHPTSKRKRQRMTTTSGR